MGLMQEIRNGENKHLEFKERLPSGDALAKTAIAFANTGGGKLLIGIDDEGKVVGVDPAVDILAMQDQAASMIHDSCHPNILPDLYTISIEDRPILVMEVYPGTLMPYYLRKYGKDDGTYLRVGASNRRASQENIRELERQRLSQSFDAEINREIPLADLDLSPLEGVFGKNGKVLDGTVLKNLRLTREESGTVYPTNALLILLGKMENARCKCSRFKGTTMDVFIDRKEYDGDLFSQLEAVDQFIKNHISLTSEFQGLTRHDEYEIPLIAIRESLINAFVHRDYVNQGRDLKVGIFDDMVDIVSPGSLPATMTLADLQTGRSEVRNRVLARVLKELGFMEQWGSGIARILSSCRSRGIKEPMIRVTGDYVEVCLFREPGGTALLKEELLPPSDQEGKILKWLGNEPEGITTRQTMVLLGVGERRAREILTRMVAQGRLWRVGQTTTSRYVLREQVR